MKKALLLLSLTITAFSAFAQQTPPAPKKDPDVDMIPEPPHDTTTVNGVYKSVEQEPEFPGGWKAYNEFLKKKIRYPKTAADAQGKVYLQFIVEKNGSLSDIHVIRGLAPEFDAEALRVIRLSPKWSPGLQKGKPVRVLFKMPVSFTIE